MPNYNFQNKKTGKKHTEFLWISEVDSYLKENPDEVQLLNEESTKLVDSWRMGRKKHDEGFRSVLKRMKNYYGPKSTIDLM